jgi:competence protein ComEC
VLVVYLSCAWVAGIFLGSKLDLPWPFFLAGLAPLPLLFFTNHRKYIIFASTGIFILVSAATYSFGSLNTVDESRLHYYNDRGDVELTGKLLESPDVRDNNTRLVISSEEISWSGDRREVDGKVLLFVPRYPAYEYGDVLRITGELRTPPQLDEFDYQEYLTHQGIHAIIFYPDIEVLDREQGFTPFAWVLSLRNQLAENLAEALPEPQASLAQGIILGIRGNIPEDLKNDFSVSGTAHLLAISGLHLGIMAGILLGVGLWLFGKKRYLYVWLAIGAIWFYVLLTGMHLPVVRGAIMATVFLVAELLGRQRSAIVALTLAAAVMVGFSPYVLGDASFQLSFLAMTGLIFLFPIFRNFGMKITVRIFGEEGTPLSIANLFVDALSATFGAVIAVWPLVAYYFGIISLVGPLATLLVLPALPAIIILGSITGFIGLVIPEVAYVFGWLVWLFLSYMTLVISGIAGSPISSVAVDSVNPIFLWVYYPVLAIVIWLYGNWNRLRHHEIEFHAGVKSGVPFKLPRNIQWTIIPLLVTAVLVVYTAFTMPDDKLHVSFLDVGQGDAVLIQRGNQQILIDGGPSPQKIILELGDRMPFWDRTIDLLVLTHPHSDHLAGLVEVMRRYRVERVLFNGMYDESPLYSEWQRLIDENGIETIVAFRGQQIKPGNGIIIDVCHPPADHMGNTESDIDNNSVVLRLSVGDVTFLFTGDIMTAAERELIMNNVCLSSDILKVGHHGSDTSSSAEFLAAVGLRVAVISCGEDNKFKCPSVEVLSRLENGTGEIDIFRTDRDGTIDFTTDGEKLWVEVER